MPALSQMKHSDKPDASLFLLKHMCWKQGDFVTQDSKPMGNSPV